MKQFETTILMEPVGKGRPRVTFQHGRVHTFTPDKTSEAEDLIRLALLKNEIHFHAGTPLEMELIFYLPKPKSVKRQYPAVKPDIDNYVKLVMDSLQHFLYPNDSQIVNLKASKRYAVQDELPRIYIRVREIGG